MPTADQPHILVVDDNRDNANIVRQYLEAVCGFTITVAYDGDEALQYFEAKRPNVILLDVMMPGRDGWDVCRTIKQQLASEGNPDASSVRIIMVTALDDVWNRAHALQTGADDFLEKPFDLAKLAATVRRNLEALAQPNAA